MLEHTFTCPLPNGVHARPASALEEVARPFASAISILNERTGQAANAKSVLGIVATDIRLGDCCRLTVTGPDERKAFDALTTFLDHQFPHYDDALPVIETPADAVYLPPLLRQAGADVRPGLAVVPGIGQGRAVLIGGFAVPPSIPTTGVTNIPAEVARVDGAIERLSRRYEARLERAAGVEAAVLKAHRSITRDPEFRERLHAPIRERGATAAGAIADAETHFTAMLLATGSALLRERALDIRDVCLQLVAEVYGDAVKSADVELVADSVCIADNLTPGQFLALDRRYLRGLVLAHGGTTSHTVILARSFGIPTLVGVGDIATGLGHPSAAAAPGAPPKTGGPTHDSDTVGLPGFSPGAPHTGLQTGGPTHVTVQGQEVIVDADLGVLVTGVTEAARRYYDMERRRLEGRRLRLRRFVERPGATSDGRRIEVAANIGTANEATPAFASGAEGIGLFRTEMLFVDRDEPPPEDEQFEQYRRVLAAADGRSVIIRTLDVGGDKPIAYLNLPREDNPFLGYRAVRLYPDFDAIFRAQIAALVRASAFGRLKVMIPMVSRVEEARFVRQVIAEEQAKCAQARVGFDQSMQVGAMVEVPSLAFLLDRLCPELDFFSIGTNDLLQYFMAVDRANPKIADLYNALNPAFLRLLKTIVDQAHARDRWVGLCGEMGGQLRSLPLLVGLGLDEISMASPAIGPAKAELASLSASACAELLDEAFGCSTAQEVETLVERFACARPAPLIEPDLVVVDGEGQTKEEAIKEIVDRLYVAGRTERPREVEEAVWRREAVYSTGFGHGFAIPHCKTDAVRTNSLAVLKLKIPVEWGSLDEKPVGVVLLLVIRESDQATEHMKVLASLARKVMHEEFRDRLAQERDSKALCRFLEESLGGARLT
jgi:fructose-specific PTS system IIA-like component